MARSSTPRGPSTRSLREIPEVDFTRYVMRRNRFALRVQQTGIQIAPLGRAPGARTRSVRLRTARSGQ